MSYRFTSGSYGQFSSSKFGTGFDGLAGGLKCRISGQSLLNLASGANSALLQSSDGVTTFIRVAGSAGFLQFRSVVQGADTPEVAIVVPRTSIDSAKDYILSFYGSYLQHGVALRDQDGTLVSRNVVDASANGADWAPSVTMRFGSPESVASWQPLVRWVAWYTTSNFSDAATTPTPSDTGVAAFWPFDEGTGTTAGDDDSSPANMTLSGGEWVSDTTLVTKTTTASVSLGKELSGSTTASVVLQGLTVRTITASVRLLQALQASTTATLVVQGVALRSTTADLRLLQVRDASTTATVSTSGEATRSTTASVVLQGSQSATTTASVVLVSERRLTVATEVSVQGVAIRTTIASLVGMRPQVRVTTASVSTAAVRRLETEASIHIVLPQLRSTTASVRLRQLLVRQTTSSVVLRGTALRAVLTDIVLSQRRERSVTVSISTTRPTLLTTTASLVLSGGTLFDTVELVSVLPILEVNLTILP